MKILVLGAGVVGVTTAWYLRQEGFDVAVIERREAAGLETSFANGGQISVSHALPWANPDTPLQALSWLGKEDAPLLFRLRPFDLPLLAWSLAFLGNCLPGRTRKNIRAIVKLALYSREKLQTLRASLSQADNMDFCREYDALQKGILHLYTDEKSFSKARDAALLMRDFGLERLSLDAKGCLAVEPALTHTRLPIIGGDYTPSDESGDAHRFTQAMERRAAGAGVQFLYNTVIHALCIEGGRFKGVFLKDGRRIDAGACVVALGSYSTPFLRPYGIDLPVYPAKGYSVTLNLLPERKAIPSAPSVSLTDDRHKLVFSRLGERLRIAGTAEFNGYNLELNPVRCQAILKRVKALFPELCFEGEPQFWCGLRPSTPSNVPLIGKTRVLGLWLNTGHGTLGWTLSCGSASLLSEWMAGKIPEVEFPFQA